jgi:hypothetical protein
MLERVATTSAVSSRSRDDVRRRSRVPSFIRVYVCMYVCIPLGLCVYVYVRRNWLIFMGICLYWRSFTDVVGSMELRLFVSGAIQLFPRRFC